MAKLMNMAGEGLPAWLWSQMAEPGDDPMAFGARRVAGTEGGFSYTHVHVAEVDDALAGMLLGYRLADPYDTSDLNNCPEVVRPLLKLESMAPGSWYVNAVATAPEFRGRGIGSRLMGLAEQLAGKSGAGRLSLIVAEANRGAVLLYERLGYETVATRRVIAFPDCPHDGNWILMTRDIVSTA